MKRQQPTYRRIIRLEASINSEKLYVELICRKEDVFPLISPLKSLV